MADLEDEVAAALASDLEYKLREMTQEADKFRRHAKRSPPPTTHTPPPRVQPGANFPPDPRVYVVMVVCLCVARVGARARPTSPAARKKRVKEVGRSPPSAKPQAPALAAITSQQPLECRQFPRHHRPFTYGVTDVGRLSIPQLESIPFLVSERGQGQEVGYYPHRPTTIA